MTDQNIFQQFQTASRESLRLKAALTGYFSDETEINPTEKQTLQNYLKRRIRPAAEYLLTHKESEKLSILWRNGLLSEPVLRETASLAQKNGNIMGWIRCMQMLRGQDPDEEISPQQKRRTRPDQKVNPAQEIQAGRRADPEQVQKISSERKAREENRPPDQPATRARAAQILQRARSRLYELFPDLSGAVSVLEPQESIRTKTAGTDGYRLLYHPEFIVSAWRQDPTLVTRMYLHILLHCLYQDWKIFTGENKDGIKISGQIPEGNQGSGAGSTSTPAREKEADISLKIDAQIERIINQEAGQALACCAYLPDDHSLWPDVDAMARQEQDDLSLLWESLAGKAGISSGHGGAGHFGIGTDPGSDSIQAGRIRQSRYDYRRFLEHFTVFGETMEIDLESFDYNYYTLGMDFYGNTPLIEPLEYKEGYRLQELVIAIDTSGSCSRELVERFLSESYAILGRKENFFKKMKVYFIQCDCVIQDVALIQSREDWMRYIDHLQIRGRSGTDFTPVFRYIEKLRERKELAGPKGLIYFTDGNGVYPTQAPDYETAFVFVKKELFQEKVPGWALQLELDSR